MPRVTAAQVSSRDVSMLKMVGFMRGIIDQYDNQSRK